MYQYFCLLIQVAYEIVIKYVHIATHKNIIILEEVDL